MIISLVSPEIGTVKAQENIKKKCLKMSSSEIVTLSAKR